MKKQTLLWISLIMCVLMTFVSCTGANTDKQNTVPSIVDPSTTLPISEPIESTTAFPIVEEKITLEVMTPIELNVEDYNTNALTLEMEEKTNIHILWNLVPRPDIQQKVNLILASNTDLPDIFMDAPIDTTTIMSYGQQGVFIPLNDYC